MKNLENFGVQELNAKELEEVSGGFFGLLLGVVFVTGLLWGLIDGKDKEFLKTKTLSEANRQISFTFNLTKDEFKFKTNTCFFYISNICFSKRPIHQNRKRSILKKPVFLFID